MRSMATASDPSSGETRADTGKLILSDPSLQKIFGYGNVHSNFYLDSREVSYGWLRLGTLE